MNATDQWLDEMLAEAHDRAEHYLAARDWTPLEKMSHILAWVCAAEDRALRWRDGSWELTEGDAVRLRCPTLGMLCDAMVVLEVGT